MWATIRDYLTPLDVLDMRTAGQKWNCAKLHGSFAALWFFLMKKDGREEGTQPEWPTLSRDHWKKSEMLGALYKARDEAGEWGNMYEGHLLHELVCAGGTTTDPWTTAAPDARAGGKVGQLPKKGRSSALWEDSSDDL